MKPEAVPEHAPDYDVDVLPILREVSLVWVATWKASLARDGRTMQGGFPGTKAEARARVMSSVAPALAKRGLPVLAPAEAARAAHDLYAAARKAWLSEAISEG